MKSSHYAYQQFIQWIQEDMNKDRLIVNRKVFSVVFWCLVLPAMVSLVIYGLRKFQLIATVHYLDQFLFLPPFLYALYSLWPTLRELPSVFKKGGLSSVLEESAREVEWKEQVILRLRQEVRLTHKEWELVAFYLDSEIRRLRSQNRYLSTLSGVVLFFMFQFLDLGGSAEVMRQQGSAGLVSMWVDQFSQWGGQIFSLILFSCLFYLSGTQIQKHLERYRVCVSRIAAHFTEEN
jgi:hypothetical protein